MGVCISGCCWFLCAAQHCNTIPYTVASLLTNFPALLLPPLAQQDSTQCAWKPSAAHHALTSGHGAAEAQHQGLAEGMAWALPHALLAAAQQLPALSDSALRCLRSDMRL